MHGRSDATGGVHEESDRERGPGHVRLPRRFFRFHTPDYQNGPPGPPPPNNTYTFSLLIDNYGTSPSVSFPLIPNAPNDGSGGTVGTGVTYPVQCLYTSNPVYAAVRALWNPNASSPSPASYCATAPPC